MLGIFCELLIKIYHKKKQKTMPKPGFQENAFLGKAYRRRIEKNKDKNLNIIPKFAIETIFRRKLRARKSAANFLGYPDKHNENHEGIFIGRPCGRILLLQNPGLLFRRED